MRVTINGDEKQVDEACTVSRLLDELEYDPERVAVEVDREVVPGDAYQNFELSAGSEVEIVTFVGGG